MQGKTIVATGATSGIGERAVEALAGRARASSSSHAMRGAPRRRGQNSTRSRGVDIARIWPISR
jgi:NAD(P)-dependent dehydrogenase (short-subunit alcohol dehydrogenase family)